MPAITTSTSTVERPRRHIERSTTTALSPVPYQIIVGVDVPVKQVMHYALIYFPTISFVISEVY